VDGPAVAQLDHLPGWLEPVSLVGLDKCLHKGAGEEHDAHRAQHMNGGASEALKPASDGHAH
jgi:hypothetical protein